ncbi:MAG: FAD-dependent oxidoreductase [Candidatus Geothermincolia bacterium]
MHTWESLGLPGNKSEMELESDVVVVGTGAGGAPLAYELSAAGYSVTLLEEGGYFPTESFGFDCCSAVKSLYKDGGMTFALGVPIALCPVGKTVGGTTTINQGTALRMPPDVLETWRADYGVDNLMYDELSLYYQAVEEFIYVSRSEPSVAGHNAQKFIDGARSLGLDADYLPRNAKDCEGFGVCCFGCPSGAKQSTNVSYIPEAIMKGAEVYADCKVEKVLQSDGRATGVTARFVDHETGFQGPRLTAHGKVVVLACGAIGTPMLLFHNKLANSSGQVGRNYRMHPVTQVVPIFDERTDPHRGVSQSAWVHDFLDQGISLETTVLPPDMLSMTIPHAAGKHAEIMSQYPYSGLFGVMIKDSSSGRIIPRPGGGSTILYQIGRKDLDAMAFGNVVAAEIAFAAGAERVITMIAGHDELTGMADVERLRNSRIKARQYYAMSGWHPMGTCRMGGEAASSVVRPTCETWDVDNLFICDASIFPTALGVNPQLTIMALSMRCAGFIDEKLTGQELEKSLRLEDAATSA